MEGIITGINDHGTIVIVSIRGDDGRNELVFMDHGPFRWMAEGGDGRGKQPGEGPGRVRRRLASGR